MARIKISWNDVEDACQKLVQQVSKNRYDAVICIGSGGMVPGKIVSELLNLPLGIVAVQRYSNRKVTSTIFLDAQVKWLGPKPKTERILLVDDIIDQGHTIQKTANRLKRSLKPKKIDIGTLFFKPNKIKVDLSGFSVFYANETDDWIVFPWELKP